MPAVSSLVRGHDAKQVGTTLPPCVQDRMVNPPPHEQRRRPTGGILCRLHPHGSQRLPGGARGDWWASFHCTQQHRHRIKVGPKSQALEQHGILRRKARLENYSPNNERRTSITVEAFSKRYI